MHLQHTGQNPVHGVVEPREDGPPTTKTSATASRPGAIAKKVTPGSAGTRHIGQIAPSTSTGRWLYLQVELVALGVSHNAPSVAIHVPRQTRFFPNPSVMSDQLSR